MQLKKKQCIDCPDGELRYIKAHGRCEYHDRAFKQQQAFEKADHTVKKVAKPISPVSSKQAARLRKYGPIAKKFKEEHPECEIQVDGCTYWTTDVHHSKGKDGELLFDVRYFVAGCRVCHDWAEAHPTAAKAMGVSADRLTLK